MLNQNAQLQLGVRCTHSTGWLEANRAQFEQPSEFDWERLVVSAEDEKQRVPGVNPAYEPRAIMDDGRPCDMMIDVAGRERRSACAFEVQPR